MSGRWFRFYDDVLDDPKVQLLSPELFKVWVNILCIASKNGGKIPPFSDLAYRLRMSCQDVEARVSDLTLAGLIDILPNKALEPHNWHERQKRSDVSTDRVRKHRASKPKRDETVPKPFQERDETVQEKSRAELERDKELVNPLPPVGNGKGQHGFKIGFEVGRVEVAKATDVREHTIRRAEQIGLPIDEIIAEARRGSPENLDAYVQAICRRRLKLQLPNASDEFLRKAFTRDAAAYRELLNLLSMVP